MMKGWFYVNSTCQLCLKPGTPELSALLRSGALGWLDWTTGSRRNVHSWLLGTRAPGLGSIGQLAPMYCTDCLLCPHAWGEAVLCMCGYSWDKNCGGGDLVMRHQGTPQGCPIRKGLISAGLKALSTSLALAVTADKPSSAHGLLSLISRSSAGQVGSHSDLLLVLEELWLQEDGWPSQISFLYCLPQAENCGKDAKPLGWKILLTVPGVRWVLGRGLVLTT